MKQPYEMPWILNCRRLPMLVSRSQAKELLGLHDDDKVSKILKEKLLTARGDRSRKQKILIYSDEIEEKKHDERWADKVALIEQGKSLPTKKKKAQHEKEL